LSEFGGDEDFNEPLDVKWRIGNALHRRIGRRNWTMRSSPGCDVAAGDERLWEVYSISGAKE
jgi:hypothetical protein